MMKRSCSIVGKNFDVFQLLNLLREINWKHAAQVEVFFDDVIPYGI